MSNNIIQLNQELIHSELKDLVKNSVEETLNALLDHEAAALVNAQKYERSAERQGYRAGHYNRKLQTTAGNVELKVPKLKGLSFETAIIERYRRRESSVEEALIEITCPLSDADPYVYVDGVYLKRSWGGEIRNVSVLVAIGVNTEGTREILGAAEGLKEDRESWRAFFVWLKSRGLQGVQLIIGDKNLGMLESLSEIFPDAAYQRCTVHFYRNVFSVTPRNKMRAVSLMLKAIHAQESKVAARAKARQVAARLREMKLSSAAKKVEDGIEETLTYMNFPTEHWRKIRTNNAMERVNREIKRRTKAIGAFPDGESALMLVCARLRYVANSRWGCKVYMNMNHLNEMADESYKYIG